MLSLQVYCSVSSVEMVAADMGEGIALYLSVLFITAQ